MGQVGPYSQLPLPVDCNPKPGGKMEATSVRGLDHGSSITTTTIGTPDQFVGASEISTPEMAEQTVPVDSKNLGRDHHISGTAASLGQQDQMICQARKLAAPKVF